MKAKNDGVTLLRERNVLVSPGKEDVVVDRYFKRVEVEVNTAPPKTTTRPAAW